MPKKKPRGRLTGIVLIAALAVVAFVAGEAWLMTRTDRGQLTLERWLPGADAARVNLLVGKRLREGLKAAGVPADSIREASEAAGEGGGEIARWRVGLQPGASFLQVNYSVTRHLEDAGIEVTSGRERYSRDGQPQVVLSVAHEGSQTHELLLVRGTPPADGPPQTDARMAVVVFGFGEDLELARSWVARAAPFAVALAPGDKPRTEILEAAREREREIVLHLPLEPINYPQVNPGPGTILVTMKPTQIAGHVRRYLDQTGPVSAVMNLMGSLATQDMTVMAAVYRELRAEKLPFLHVAPVAGSVCKSLAAELGVAYEHPDEVIEREPLADTPAALDQRWKQVLAGARDRHRTIVLIRATPRTLEWLPRALEVERLKGVSAVPLASVLRRPTN
jgi:polysaccharide deacetylase 2 family uncharacterized protein YibQ